MADARLQVLLDFKSKLAGINQAQNGIRSITRNIAGMTAALVGGASAVTAVRSGVRSIMEFDTQMLRVKALTSATNDEFTKLRNQARDLGSTTQFSAGQAADAMGFLAMAGFDVNQIYGAMPGVLNLAAAGSLGIAESADIASNVLTGYRLEVQDLAEVNDVLAKAFTSSNTDLSALGNAFTKVGPVAAALNIPLTETTAVLAKLAQANFRGEEGGTALRNVLLRLTDATPEAQKAMKELGVSLETADGQFIGIVNAIAQFEDAQKRFSPNEFNQKLATIFGARGFAPVASIIGQTTESVRELEGELKTAGGTSQRIADIQMSGLRGSFLRLKSAAEGLALSVGDEGASGALGRLMDTGTAVVRLFDDIVNSSNPWDMISLSITAAFEEGLKGAKKAVKTAFSDDAVNGVWAPLSTSVVNVSVGIAKVLLDGMIAPISTVSAAWTWLFEHLRELATNYVNWVIKKWKETVLGFGNWINTGLAVLRLPMLPMPDFDPSKDFFDPKPARNFLDIQTDQIETLDDMVTLMKDGLNENLKETNEFLGKGTKELEDQFTALERLNKLREEERLNRESEDASGSTTPAPVGGEAPGTPGKSGTASGVDTGGRFLSSLIMGSNDGLKTFVKNVGTAKEQIVDMINGIEEGFTNIIDGSLQGLIQGTLTWRDALANIGTNILSTVIGSIVKMASTWMAKQIAMFILGQKLKAADSATTAAKAATDTAVMTPAAILASISSFGAAAAIGLAAVLAVVAGLGGFQSGGHTGYGRDNEVAGVAHRNEYVIPADVTRAMGAGTFDSIVADTRAGRTAGAAVSAPPRSERRSKRGGYKSLIIDDNPSRIQEELETFRGELEIVKRAQGIV